MLVLGQDCNRGVMDPRGNYLHCPCWTDRPSVAGAENPGDGSTGVDPTDSEEPRTFELGACRSVALRATAITALASSATKLGLRLPSVAGATDKGVLAHASSNLHACCRLALERMSLQSKSAGVTPPRPAIVAGGGRCPAHLVLRMQHLDFGDRLTAICDLDSHVASATIVTRR